MRKPIKINPKYYKNKIGEILYRKYNFETLTPQLIKEVERGFRIENPQQCDYLANQQLEYYLDGLELWTDMPCQQSIDKIKNHLLYEKSNMKIQKRYTTKSEVELYNEYLTEM